jgi:hypothetical protein
MSKGNRTRRREAGLLPMPQKCSAHKKDGTPCQRPPIKGAKVCYHHGGAAPQVKEKAAQRLREGVMPMLGALYRIAHDESQPPAVRLGAIRDWLDRSGVKEAISVEVTVQPWERLVEGIVSEVPDEALSRASHVISGDEYSELLVLDAEDVTPPRPAPPQPSPVPTPQVQPPIPSRRRRGRGLRRG